MTSDLPYERASKFGFVGNPEHRSGRRRRLYRGGLGGSACSAHIHSDRRTRSCHGYAAVILPRDGCRDHYRRSAFRTAPRASKSACPPSGTANSCSMASEDLPDRFPRSSIAKALCPKAMPLRLPMAAIRLPERMRAGRLPIPDSRTRRSWWTITSVRRMPLPWLARQLVAGYYGDRIERAYFGGCSNGGRMALMEAQRYPDDYDGIIAGAPFMDCTCCFLRSR